MEEITFEDALTHYQIKLREISDRIDTMRNRIRKAQDHIDLGWRGPAADACRAKLEYADERLVRALSEISEAQIKLSLIGEELYSDQITLI